MNLTWTATHNDSATPYQTLPIVFENSHTLQFTVPKANLNAGTYYELRMGFPFPTHTFYTNSRVLKTYDANSPYVGNVQTSSTNGSVSLTWDAPEYADGIVGYTVRISYQTIGNGIISNPQWNSTTLTLLQSVDLSLSSTTITFGCLSGVTNGTCLSSYTTYYVDVSVIRELGPDPPRGFYVSTLQTIIPIVRYDTATFFLHGASVTFDFVLPVQTYSADTRVSSTFLFPLSIQTKLGDVVMSLNEAVVTSISNTSLVVTMSEDDYGILLNGLFNVRHLTRLQVTYGSASKTIVVQYHCEFIF